MVATGGDADFGQIAKGLGQGQPVIEFQAGCITVAVNVEGAVVPSAVAIYLICHDRPHVSMLIATLAVIAIVFAVARPVSGVGGPGTGRQGPLDGKHGTSAPAARVCPGRALMA